MEIIARRVCECFGADINDVRLTRKHSAQTGLSRKMILIILKDDFGCNINTIGEYMNMSPRTIYIMINKFRKEIAKNPVLSKVRGEIVDYVTQKTKEVVNG